MLPASPESPTYSPTVSEDGTGPTAQAHSPPRTMVRLEVQVQGAGVVCGLEVRRFVVCRHEVCANDEVVVWRSTQRRGWGSKRKRCVPSAALFRDWLYSEEHNHGTWDALGSPYWADGSRLREPECITGVCPPGSHFLERRVKVTCNTRRRKSAWSDEFTWCGEELTHRCALCPYWRCADNSCDGAAWDDSDGAVNAWNEERPG